ncbi:E3 ubiquitin-protein ligase ZNRF1 [Condylostylus longicornis]|uniref:E3 ubiquitin-protein ligase ZNRF1 n=1 Tax=Condylostylus longicornis TaxID=2530218 RepID=UPI00244E194D|nr:E3 ubiquitin-protein ligase ZNRF1 [Condylostylus longicornis]
MGAKASTAQQNGTQSPRSSTDVVSAGAAGFNLLRQNDRQRARSLSSVPDLQSSNNNNNTNNSNSNNSHHHHHNNHHVSMVQGGAQIYGDESSIIVGGGGRSGEFDATGIGIGIVHHQNNDENGQSGGISSGVQNSALGRVYTATSLPSHIWSLNGIKCPVCSKFVLPDDIECHLVMCLTKPRLSYNEDILNDPKGECVICLEDLNPGDVIARLPCLCIYHKGCIDRWFEVNRCCPEHPGD